MQDICSDFVGVQRFKRSVGILWGFKDVEICMDSKTQEICMGFKGVSIVVI